MRSTLFIITGLAIGYQTFIHMIMFVCGSSGFDLRPVKLMPLAGAVLLIFSAFIPIRVSWIRWVALVACVIPWVYFGPGLYFYFQAIVLGQDYFDILILLPSLLLLTSTIYAAHSIRNRHKSESEPRA